MGKKQQGFTAATDSTGLPKVAPVPPPPREIIDNIMRSALKQQKNVKK